MTIIFTFFAVMVVTAVLFGGWVLMFVVRTIAGLFKGAAGTSSFGNSSRTCGNASCRTINPRHANFCRRCGTPMDQSIASGFRPNAPAPQFNPPNSPARQVARA